MRPIYQGWIWIDHGGLDWRVCISEGWYTAVCDQIGEAVYGVNMIHVRKEIDTLMAILCLTP